jgi:hypothetical protein
MKIMSKGMRWSAAVPAAALVLSSCSFTNWTRGGSVAAQTSELTYPIVDTGRTKTYNNTSEIAVPSEGEAFYGQDGQIDGNPLRYVDNGDATVTDLVTDLIRSRATPAR